MPSPPPLYFGTVGRVHLPTVPISIQYCILVRISHILHLIIMFFRPDSRHNLCIVCSEPVIMEPQLRASEECSITCDGGACAASIVRAFGSACSGPRRGEEISDLGGRESRRIPQSCWFEASLTQHGVPGRRSRATELAGGWHRKRRAQGDRRSIRGSSRNVVCSNSRGDCLSERAAILGPRLANWGRGAESQHEDFSADGRPMWRTIIEVVRLLWFNVATLVLIKKSVYMHCIHVVWISNSVVSPGTRCTHGKVVVNYSTSYVFTCHRILKCGGTGG